MENKKGFEEVYEELQRDDSQELDIILEQAKKERRKVNTIILIICVIIDLVIIYSFADMNSRVNLMMLFIQILFVDLFIFVIGMFFRKKGKEYNQKFKQIVIKKLMDNFYDNLEYFPYKPMPERIYKEAKYKEYYNRYRSDDYLEAKINNNYDISMAEVITEEEETETDSDGNTHTTTDTIFHGLFAKIVIDKSINSELRIQRNSILPNKKRLEMDSSEFEKKFDVYSSNKIIGMQILTADIMEMLIEFRNRTKNEFDIVINNNEIYLRFHCGTMFEATSLKKGAFDEKTLREYYNILDFTYKLSTKLIDIIKEVEI